MIECRRDQPSLASDSSSGWISVVGRWPSTSTASPFRSRTAIVRSMPLPFRLATDGDDLERRCRPLFVTREFPSYEKFWYVFVAPLTNRERDRVDVHFKSDTEAGARFLRSSSMVPRATSSSHIASGTDVSRDDWCLNAPVRLLPGPNDPPENDHGGEVSHGVIRAKRDARGLLGRLLPAGLASERE